MSIAKYRPSKGFLAENEGELLYRLALDVADIGPCMELGSYCGLSTVFLGSACKRSLNTLYAIDHHRGSEEHQPGELYHDKELFDAELGRMNTYPEFCRTLLGADIEDVVIPVIASSEQARRHWATALGLVFIDGGHSEKMAMDDCLGWSQHLLAGAVLAIHDIYPSPELGGQGPRLAMQAVLDGGDFVFEEQLGSLAVLRRK
ncbi:class I SAM-dependent methyltransferase [Agaribacterium haliotis]|uniref:class I SAM-dependent methyltransferase n=1 Tax=Agaribacterium haliotis TaxID=2013869 RepID=UPI000BB57B90|nr:class I SAM-dependent methyltransferase [Agaribacterium haliotis]